MFRIIYREKIKARYIATPKNIPEAKIISDETQPDLMDYDYKFLEDGYFVKDHIFYVPYWILFWERFWFPDNYAERLWKRI